MNLSKIARNVVTSAIAFAAGFTLIASASQKAEASEFINTWSSKVVNVDTQVKGCTTEITDSTVKNRIYDSANGTIKVGDVQSFDKKFGISDSLYESKTHTQTDSEFKSNQKSTENIQNAGMRFN